MSATITAGRLHRGERTVGQAHGPRENPRRAHPSQEGLRVYQCWLNRRLEDAMTSRLRLRRLAAARRLSRRSRVEGTFLMVRLAMFGLLRIRKGYKMEPRQD